MGQLEDIFLQTLLDKGYVKEEDIKKAKEIQKKYHSHIGTILLNLGILSERDYLSILSELFNIPILNLNDFDNIKAVNFQEISSEFYIENNLFPFFENNDTVYVAVNYLLKYDSVLFFKSLINKNIKLFLAFEDDLQKLKQLYFLEEDDERLNLDIESQDEEVEKLKELASEAPVIKLINTHFNQAVEYNASDIHYEAFKKGMKVRFRIDGVLRTFDTISPAYKKAVIARLKLLSKMNIAENRLPQDGRISIKIMNKEIDIRASSIPTAFGESFVLRLLRKDSINYSLENLRFYSDQLQILKEIVSKPNGIFLTTGPTGSGKTTTLYSLLNELNSDEVKIITVEDPVEYELEGINQIQVKPDIGFTFANALRSILRQDPDIIMIGEIRDVETANIAIQSALTGHFVLSTLHTNSALGAITRLLDMGVEFFLLKASIKGLMAQRLVRELCPYCKERISINKDIRNILKIDKILKKYEFVKNTPYKAVGCEKCGYTGYKGRIPIAEIVPFNEEVQDRLNKDKNFNNIEELGYRSLFEDAVLKFLDGHTSYEEIFKVI